QKACVDHERAIFKVDLVEWARSFGRRPIRRPLPRLREVLVVKHLRAASRRLLRGHLPDRDYSRLAALLHAAELKCEEGLRERFRPILTNCFDRTGLTPANAAERVARRKLTEELLDRIVERGHVNLGDLRDALSRNNLKLQDLAGPVEFLR